MVNEDSDEDDEYYDPYHDVKGVYDEIQERHAKKFKKKGKKYPIYKKGGSKRTYDKK